ncbi:hypothetical protein CERZMDRAFT_92867 [Cercospora zeae-maydis SCOH1-5]|uniref:Uncharacterized protein n=1 Tax=Cercospora zeae-maydis SCOH1-5 TaxID=717836 RepID=A0A6A6FU01_9PEZI|nr:hypothetical protein CERZMDRAFT_92867 [Cercospora zeae-maydis SCOH1-5]
MRFPDSLAARGVRETGASNSGSPIMTLSYINEHDPSRDSVSKQGWKAQRVASDKAEDDEYSHESTSRILQSGDIDPGLEVLGFGPGRLDLVSPASSHQGSRHTSPSCLGEMPPLSHSPGSSTTEEYVLKEPEAAMERNDQKNVCELSGGSLHEHTQKQTTGSACEEHSARPDGSSQSQVLEKSIVKMYAGEDVNLQSTSRDQHSTTKISPSSSLRILIMHEPIVDSAHRSGSTPPELVEVPASRVDIASKTVKSPGRTFPCVSPGCLRGPFKSPWELRYV